MTVDYDPLFQDGCCSGEFFKHKTHKHTEMKSILDELTEWNPSDIQYMSENKVNLYLTGFTSVNDVINYNNLKKSVTKYSLN